MKVTEEKYTDSKGNTYTRRRFEGASLRIRDTEDGTTYECLGHAQEGAQAKWMLMGPAMRDIVTLFGGRLNSNASRVVCTLYGNDGELLLKLAMVALGLMEALEGYSGPALTGVELPIEKEDAEEPPPSIDSR